MQLSPLNDLAFSIALTDIDPATGAETPVTTGTVTAFLATSGAPDAGAADSTLNATVNYSAWASAWIVSFDASALTIAMLDAKFGTLGKAFLIVQRANSLRVYIELEYARARLAA